MGDLCFIGKEDVMRTWNIQVNTDMGDINVDDALTGKMVEDQDDCDISYTQKGTGGNLVIQTEVQITLLFTSFSTTEPFPEIFRLTFKKEC